MQSVTKSISRYLDIPFTKGVIIVEVSKDSPADKSNLEPGDIILSVNKQGVNKPSDIRTVILENDLRSGDYIELKVYRNNKYKIMKVKLGKYKF